MPGVRNPMVINGVPVVSAPADVDVITGEKLRTVLLEAAAHGHATVVVDLTGTRICDSFGLQVLATAHRQALDKGGEVRLVIPAESPVDRILVLTGLDGFFPCFTSLDRALAAPLP
ncbi:MAG: STAS domain-containing protein [Streptosporangiaceae bacterium]